ncbi:MULTISPECIES: hypothetical protein [unclassified Mesorhizobium]|uniref:hypothetical protein n=1 Tax=unclassified Mesorhizobium TaxID=325217 RepID=UPI001FE03944|nr:MULTISPECIES: hypothetical protein [unclassified Mesorhizobium]
MHETTHLPPAQIDIPAAWIGEDIAKHPETWLVELEPQDVAELEAAATSFLASSHDIGGVTKADFPLPRLGGHLAALREKLIAGIGFEVLRGFPVERYSAEMAATIFCGVGAHLGSARSQNAKATYSAMSAT